MTDTTVTFLVPEPLWIAFLFVGAVTVGLAFAAGFFKGVADERKRKGL